MDDNKIRTEKYNETMLNILIVEVNWLIAYWSISEEYNNRFIEKYGENFFEQTKEILRIRNLSNNTEEVIELNEKTNNYYVKFNYSDSVYQAELLRVGKENNQEYGYKLVSNKIHSPNVKILIDEYTPQKVSFKSIKTLEETEISQKQDFSIDDVRNLYEDTMKPSWNEYKKENGYKEK